MARGQSPRITAGVAEDAAELSDAFDAYVRRAGIVEIEALRIGKELRELALRADVADWTLGVMLSGLREDGIESVRFGRMLAALQRFHQEQRQRRPDPAGPAAQMKKAANGCTRWRPDAKSQGDCT